MGSSSQTCALGQRASQSQRLREKTLNQHKLLPSAGKIKLESKRGVQEETSCFQPFLSSHFQMDIKLSTNDLYPHGCQCFEEDEAENMVCVCMIVSGDHKEAQAVFWSPLADSPSVLQYFSTSQIDGRQNPPYYSLTGAAIDH